MNFITDNSKLFPLILGLFAFTLFSSFLPESYILDGFEYANAVENSDRSLLSYYHPHHLVYRPLISLIYNFALNFGYSGGSLIIMQLVSAISGAFTVAAFFLIARRILLRPFFAFYASLFLTGSFGFWYLSMQTDPYILSLSLLSWSFYFLIKYNSEPNNFSGLLIGLLFGFALLVSQSNVIFSLVFLYAALINGKDRRLLLFSISLPAFLTILSYGITGFLFKKIGSLPELFLWMTTYAHTGVNWTLGLRESIVGIFNSIGVAMAGGHPFLEYTYGIRGAINLIQMGVNLLSILISLGAMAILIFSIKKLYLNPDKNIKILLSLLIFYFSFFSWWGPGGYKFWVISLIPFWILVFKGIELFESFTEYRKLNIILGALAITWMSSIFIGNIFPKSIQKPPVYLQVKELNLLLGASDILIVDDFLKFEKRPELKCETFLPQFIPYYLGKKILPLSLLLSDNENFYKRIYLTLNNDHKVYSYSNLQNIKQTLSNTSDCLEGRGIKLVDEYRFKSSVIIEEIVDIMQRKRINPMSPKYERVIWELESTIGENEEM